jgi:hypothetical protein
MESDLEIIWDSNHYTYINNILYGTIKYFASKHTSVISFLWVYSECGKKKKLIIFSEKINQGRG